MNTKVFTMEDWEDSLDKHLKVGDLVDTDVVWSLMNCLPPVCMRNECMQVGEAYSTKIDDKTGQWRNTYTTFKKLSSKLYEYCGNCFCGENVERGIEIPIV